MDLLIICDNYEELNFILRRYQIKVENGSFLVATKNAGFFVQMQNNKEYKAVFLESDRQLPEEEVWTIINKINSIISNCYLNKSCYLYESMYLMEGNGVPMQISNLILAVDSLVNVVNSNNIIQIYFLVKRKYALEYQVALLLKRQMKIKLFRIYKKERNQAQISLRKHFATNSYDFGLFILLKIANIQTFIRMWALRGKKFVSKKIINNDIGILFSVDAIKHVNWLIPFLQILQEKFSYNIICVNAQNSHKKFVEEGYIAGNVESYFKPIECIKDIYDYIKDSGKILRSLKKMDKVYYQKVDLTKKIISYLKLYLWDEVFQHILYENALKSFYKFNKFMLITASGDSNFMVNKISYFLTNKEKLPPIFFKDQSGIDVFEINIKEPYSNIFQIRFLPSKKEEQKLRDNGWEGKACFAAGTVYKKIDKIREKSQLENRIKILWAPSQVVIGQNSIKAFSLNNQMILSAAKSANYELFVKYHIRENDELIEEIATSFGQIGNIHLVDKREPIEPLLESVDLVLTNASTVLFDAIIQQKPVVSIANDQSYEKIKHHKEGIEIFTDINELILFLEKMTITLETFEKWSEIYVSCANKYYNSLFTTDVHTTEEVITNKLDEIIQNRKRGILNE